MTPMYLSFDKVVFEEPVKAHRRTKQYMRDQGLIEPIVVKESMEHPGCWVVHPNHAETAQAFMDVCNEFTHGTTTLMCIDWAKMPKEDQRGI